jgi:hypothetical protein
LPVKVGRGYLIGIEKSTGFYIHDGTEVVSRS